MTVYSHFQYGCKQSYLYLIYRNYMMPVFSKIIVRRTFILICSIFVLPFFCSAGQNLNAPGADSLSRILTQKVADSLKAKACFLLVDQWSEADSLKLRQYINQGIAANKGNRFMQAVFLYCNARLSAERHPDSVGKMYLKADSELQKFNISVAFSARSRCWHDYARILHRQKDDLESYIKILLRKAIPLAKQAGDNAYLGKNYIDVAKGFKNLNELKNADLYLKKAIEILKNAHAPVTYLADAYHTSSENYSLIGNPKQAAAMLDSMKVLLTPYPDNLAWLDYYAAEGMQLTIAEQYDQSLAVINKGILLAAKLKQEYPEQRLLLQKFYALYNKKEFPQAREVAIRLTKLKPFIHLATNRSQIFYGLALTEEELKNIPQAYEWFKRYSSLSDSISKSNLENTVNALEIKFRNVENQKKIAELKTTNEKVELDAKSNRLINWLLASASSFLLIVIILGFYFYRNNKKLSVQKEQSKITQAMLQGQEDERIRVARDLHDSLGGMLAVVKINLSNLAVEDENKIELSKIINLVDSSVSELRRIAHNMMPEMLLKLGLEASIRDLCESLISEKINVYFQCIELSNTIPVTEQISIYRIIQELLANVIKHADAKNVILQCSQNENVFFITIEDDGKGFSVNLPIEKSGIGLNNIKSRVAYLNGQIEILSKENYPGTSINIELHVTA